MSNRTNSWKLKNRTRYHRLSINLHVGQFGRLCLSLPDYHQNVQDDKYSSEHSSSKLKCRHKERKRSEAINKGAVSQSEIAKEKLHSSNDYKDTIPKEYEGDSRKVYESKPQIYQDGKHKDEYIESKKDTYHSENRKRTNESKLNPINPDAFSYEKAYEEYKDDQPDRKRVRRKHKHGLEEEKRRKEKQLVHDNQDSLKVYETKHGYIAEVHTNDLPKPNSKDEYYDEASSYDEAKLKAIPDIQEDKREGDESVTDVKKPRRSEIIELTPMVAKIVEDELKDVMIKIWQSLPDGPTDPAEELVIEQLNQEAGDDLRNTLGLHITQRMLDVNNQFILLIKMSSSDYKSSDRIEFAKRHRLSHFHRLRADVFQARVRRWDHYEKFFKPRRWMCGNARCQIKPLFDFTRCPDNVKTVFDGSHDYSDAKKLEQEAASKLRQLEKPVLTADQVLAKSSSASTKTAENKVYTRTSNKTGTAKKNATSKITKAVTAKDVLSKSNNSVKADTISKGEVAKTDNKSTGTPNKTIIKKPVTPKTKTLPETKKSDTANESNQQIVNKPVANSDNSQKVNEAKKPGTKVSTAEEAQDIAKVPAIPDAEVAAAADKVVGKEASALVSKEPNKTTPAKIPAPVKEFAKTVAKESDKPAISGTIVTKETTKTVGSVPAKVLPIEPAKPVATTTKETVKTVAKSPAKSENEKPAAKATTVAQGTAKTDVKAPVKQPGKADDKVSNQTVVPTKAVATKKMNPLNEESKKTKLNSKQPISKTFDKSPIKKANENDFDELDDNDILSMLSGGIVLDECSGSDED